MTYLILARYLFGLDARLQGVARGTGKTGDAASGFGQTLDHEAKTPTDSVGFDTHGFDRRAVGVRGLDACRYRDQRSQRCDRRRSRTVR